MKNINLNLDINTFVKKFKSNITWLFYLIFVIILVMEIFIIFNSVKHLFAVKAPLADLPAQRGAHFNFTEYDAAVQRIEAGKKYFPQPPIFDNPFTNR